MDAREYQRAAERTMIDTDNDLRMVNAALGLCGEAAEIWLVDGNHSPLLEFGDLVWYVAQMCKSQGWSIDTFVPHKTHDDDVSLTAIMVRACSIADMVKKAYFHKRPLDKGILGSYLRIMMQHIYAVADDYGMDMADVYAANIDKLRRRHPDGFSPESANARMDEQ
jgi:hypothetical protein